MKYELIGEIILKPIDDVFFELVEDVAVRINDVGKQTIHINKGYKTDLGSIPHWAKSITGLSSRGDQEQVFCWLLHDALFSTQGHLHSKSLKEVNKILDEMLKQSGMGGFKRWMIRTALRIGSKGPWSTYDDFDWEAINEKQVYIEWSN